MNRRSKALFQFVLFFCILIFVNVLGNSVYNFWDLTEEKRFTLTEPTVKILNELDEVVYVRVLLGGSYPAEFKRLPKAARETLEDFKSESKLIEYQFEDPLVGTIEEVNNTKTQFNEMGMVGMNLGVKDVNEQTEMIVYPYAIFNYKGRQVEVPLFENDPAIPADVQMNNSVSLLEYKFANAIQKLKVSIKPAILFTAGNGELGPIFVTDFRQSLTSFYNVGPLFLDSVTQIDPKVACLVIAKPKIPFSDRDLFKLDQYVMNGGKIMWLIDPLGVSIDSIRPEGFIPLSKNLNLDELLFNYGVRIKSNLILDLRCAQIQLKTDQTGQQKPFPWYYHPILYPDESKHPIVKNLDGVISYFPSSIDTIRTKTPVKKTILLQSSEKSRVQVPPASRLTYEILRYKPDPEKFNKGPQSVSVLLEGTFPSLFQNRVTSNMSEGLSQLGQTFKEKSVSTSMLVVSDGDLIKNNVSRERRTFPLGYDRDTRYTYANKDFLINALEYMLDDSGVIEARTKEVKLRLLDSTRVQAEKTKWQMINIVLPLAFLVLFGFLYRFWRRRKYAM